MLPEQHRKEFDAYARETIKRFVRAPKGSPEYEREIYYIAGSLRLAVSSPDPRIPVDVFQALEKEFLGIIDDAVKDFRK